MKFSVAATTLALAATALAAPSLEVRTDPQPPTPPPSDICPNDNKQVCCTGLLTCLVQVLGAPCSNDAFCCKTEAPAVSFPQQGTVIGRMCLLTYILLGRLHQHCSPQLCQHSLSSSLSSTLSFWQTSWWRLKDWWTDDGNAYGRDTCNDSQ